MKVVKNPFRINSYLLELSSSELQYLKSYFRDMASSESEVSFPASSLRSERFQRYYRHVLSVLPQNDFVYE